MHDNGVTLQKKVLQNLDIPYSYELAKRMEQYLRSLTLFRFAIYTIVMPLSYPTTKLLYIAIHLALCF